MALIVGWRRLDAIGAEYAEIDRDPLSLSGELVLAQDEAPCAVRYRVDCDRAGLTTGAAIRLRRQGAVVSRRLVRRSDETWTVDGRVVPQLAGIVDVDLSVTPSTNTLPIRRLHLRLGQQAEVAAAWVQFPSLDVAPLRQTYRRVHERRYEYHVPDLDFRAEIDVDDEGVVMTYGALWSRF